MQFIIHKRVGDNTEYTKATFESVQDALNATVKAQDADAWGIYKLNENIQAALKHVCHDYGQFVDPPADEVPHYYFEKKIASLPDGKERFSWEAARWSWHSIWLPCSTAWGNALRWAVYAAR